MPILNQPFDNQSLGEILKAKINNTEFTELNIFSAFAKNSGVLRVKKDLQEFIARGGIVNAFIGVDLCGTSTEALITLLNTCTTLTIVHAENNTTFHSKIYALSGKNIFWYSVGSNNLTLGGLWKNYESCYHDELYTTIKSESQTQIEFLRNLYHSKEYDCSIQIKSLDDIKLLAQNKYIFSESEIHLRSKKANKAINRTPYKETVKLFGTEKSYTPLLEQNKNSKSAILTKTNNKTVVSNPPPSQLESKFNDSLAKEIFWFEMRKSTGGSRNILDLSKKGKIMGGSVYGTNYEINNDLKHSLGGVKFFEISPEETDSKKNITINFMGRDYYPASILYPSGKRSNGTWRIQLKGADVDDSSLDALSKFGKNGEFIDKILIFEKVYHDYYILSLCDNNYLNTLKSQSKFWSVNGDNISSKSYGFIDELELEV